MSFLDAIIWNNVTDYDVLSENEEAEYLNVIVIFLFYVQMIRLIKG